MKIVVNILTVLLWSWCISGCSKEEKLTPSEAKENVYGNHTLPQGNHPYDTEILGLFNKYSTMFLYKYVPNDLYYNINTWQGGAYNAAIDSTTRGGYFDVPANEAYVGVQLNLLKDIWLKYYPDSLLKGGMPQKVYLLDSFYFAYPGKGKPSGAGNWPSFYDLFEGGDYILVAWGGSRINTITPAEKYAVKGPLNAFFLSIAYKRGMIKRSPAFTGLTNYAVITYTNYRDYGIIDYYRSTADKDWIAFMETIVSNSYTQLTSPGGVLHSSYDTKGLIRKKYDVMIAWFKSAFGVDLQAIGNEGA